MYFKLCKRAYDLVLSFIIIIPLLPILVFLALLIFFVDMQNPFFIQKRAGLYGEPINIIKLRSMKIVNGKSKITFLGKFLRITKFDELPQLINVLKNDMSIVGPRPLYIDFNNYYKIKHKKRLYIKPGITGLAQIKLNDSSNWHSKFNFDYIYYKNKSISLDMFILYKTFTNILSSLFDKNRRPIEKIDYLEDFFKKYAK